MPPAPYKLRSTNEMPEILDFPKALLHAIQTRNLCQANRVYSVFDLTIIGEIRNPCEASFSIRRRVAHAVDAVTSSPVSAYRDGWAVL